MRTRLSKFYSFLHSLWMNYTALSAIGLVLATTLYFHFPREHHDPKGTWIALLEAMRNKDEQKIRELTTSKGCESLRFAESDISKRLDFLQYLAGVWSDPEAELRWPDVAPHIKAEIGIDAMAQMGSGLRVTTIGFKKTPQGWKIDWVAGEG